MDREQSFQTGFIKQKTSVFETGSAQTVLDNEKQLLSNGTNIILLIDPSDEDTRLLTEDKGYYHGPFWLTWHKKLNFYPDDIQNRQDITGASKRKKIYQYHYKLKQTEKFVVEKGALDNDAYLDWYRVYQEHVARHEFGVDVFKENFSAKDGFSKGNLSVWGKVFLRDPDNQKVVGGFLLRLYPERGICKIHGAAFDKNEPYQKLSFSYKAFHEVILYARENQYAILSYGSDMNFYGEIANPTLQKHKASLGFMPFLDLNHPILDFRRTRIIKVLNFDRPHMFFSFVNQDKTKLQAHVFGEDLFKKLSFPWGMKANCKTLTAYR